MKDLWTRLEALAKRAGQTLALRPGASEAAIAAAEGAMSLSFPPDFRASLLLHDGQDGGPTAHDQEQLFPWMAGCSPLAPLDAIVQQWTDEKPWFDDTEQPIELEDGRLYSSVFHPKRIPIAGTPFWDQDNTHLDLYPGPNGTVGQLITLVSECDFVVLGTSFEDALRAYVDGLESGAWVNASDGLDHLAYYFTEWRAGR